ncbi:MAG: hypothetical protein Crog3KO_06980 [Crocinitomicaceae bacterium]
MFQFSSFAQDSFTFPENLHADPYSYALKQLKVKSIEQRSHWIKPNRTDTTIIDTSTFLQYAVDYNESNKVVSFKYDFEREYDLNGMDARDARILRAYRNDSSRLHLRISNGDSTYYNYYENIFHYDDYHGLMRIEVVSPSRMFIDGVYMRPPSAKVITTKDYYENVKISKREVFEDDTLIKTLYFEYLVVSDKSSTYYLLSKLEEHTETNTHFYTIDYEFY